MADGRQQYVNPGPPPYHSGGYPAYQGYGYPPPQPGQPLPQHPNMHAYQEGMHTTNMACVVTQPVVVQQRLGPHPVTVTCPTGNHQVTTQIHHEVGALTWVVFAVIFFVSILVFPIGLFFVWVPFVVNDCKDVVHTCPVDHTVIGVYKRM